MSSLGIGAWSWGDRSRYWQNELDKDSNLTVSCGKQWHSWHRLAGAKHMLVCSREQLMLVWSRVQRMLVCSRERDTRVPSASEMWLWFTPFRPTRRSWRLASTSLILQRRGWVLLAWGEAGCCAVRHSQAVSR